MNNLILTKKILDWYDNNKRTLPWRKKCSQKQREYFTLVSEFMLQQTQVSTVIPYFKNFIKNIPDLDSLAQINKKTKDYSLWKIHYCADFADIGHHDGLQCIPVFQVLVPTLTLEPTDVVIQQWTILRELN